jgi:hypothetical protein
VHSLLRRGYHRCNCTREIWKEGPLQRTLREHIAYLEQKIEIFKKELEEPEKSLMERSELRTDLGIAERSLVFFRKAFDLEQKISH